MRDQKLTSPSVSSDRTPPTAAWRAEAKTREIRAPAGGCSRCPSQSRGRGVHPAPRLPLLFLCLFLYYYYFFFTLKHK